MSTRYLSIPLTWDFSLHLCNNLYEILYEIYFQFPLLGIFPCIQTATTTQQQGSIIFQFPLLGIFPCIKELGEWIQQQAAIFQFPLLGIFPCICMLPAFFSPALESLSIPLTWDFSLHHANATQHAQCTCATFNSPYLGFFLASRHT